MNFKEQEQRLEIFKKAGWICENCGNRLSRYGTQQLGHRIPQQKMYIKMYSKDVVHHKLNMAACCCLRCNNAVSINGKTLLIEKLVDKIMGVIENDKEQT